MTTVFHVGLDRRLGLGLTGINSLVPCSGFPPTEESVPNIAFPRSVSALRPIPLELSIVRTDKLKRIFRENSFGCWEIFSLFGGDYGLRCRRKSIHSAQVFDSCRVCSFT